jgi:CheY-like chemotaxis protein
MGTHRGRKLQLITSRLGYSADYLSVKLNVSRQTISRWFELVDLDIKVINSVGKAIGYDFKTHFPDLYMDTNSPLVYVIDDGDLDIIILKHSINKVVSNTRIEAFKNGNEAISRLLHVSINTPEQLPDCIFLDLNMPVSDGWDFMLNFERLNIDPLGAIRIFILTSSVWESDAKKSREVPFIEELILKPIRLDKIKSIFNQGYQISE